MRKFLKITLVTVGSLLVLLLAAIAYLVATFDPDSVKPLLVQRVQKDYQRTLAIPGPISLSFMPRLGLRLGEVSLSEHGRGETFASLRAAEFSLALLPLLRRQVVVDRIAVQGLKLHIVRAADGSLNTDDLGGKPAGDAAPAAPADAASGGAAALAFDIAGISLVDAELVFDDARAPRRVELSKVSLQTGRIAPGTPAKIDFSGHLRNSAPALDTDLSLAGELLLDPARRRFGARGLKAQADGRIADGTLQAVLDLPQLALADDSLEADKLALRLTVKQGTRTLQAQLALPSFKGSASAFQLPAITGEASVEDGALKARATLSGALEGDLARQRLAASAFTLVLDGRQGDTAISGRLALPWTADLKAGAVTLPRMDIEASLPNPAGGALALKAQGGLGVDLGKSTLDGQLAGKLDQSAFKARIGLPRFAPLAIRFDVDIDQIDLDRYRRAGPAQPAARPGAPEQPLDLGALKTLDASGRLRIGAVKVMNLKASALQLGLHAAGGRLALEPLAARLYQGSVAGSATVQAADTPRLGTVLALSGVDLGPLLKDLTGKDSIAGRGNVALDLSAGGKLPSALMKSLAGKARLELKDGAVHGFNIAQALRKAKARLGGGGGEAQVAAAKDEATDFSEFSGSFVVARGVAHNEDLQAKSPLLRLAGAGDIDIAEGRLDYLVKATVVPTLQGQGGPELQALRGQTLPVRLKGPFSDIGFQIDLAGMLKAQAQQQLDDKGQALKDEAKKKLGDKLKGLLGR